MRSLKSKDLECGAISGCRKTPAHSHPRAKRTRHCRHQRGGNAPNLDARESGSVTRPAIADPWMLANFSELVEECTIPLEVGKFTCVESGICELLDRCAGCYWVGRQIHEHRLGMVDPCM